MRPEGWHHSKKTKDKISKSNTGKCHSEETKMKMSKIKKKNPVKYWLGKKRPSPSEYTKQKMSESAKRNGNKPPVHYGVENNLWKGGVSEGRRTGYKSEGYRQWRKAIFERDNYICQFCGKVGVYLTAHHIKSYAHYPELRLKLDNGITLCEGCHSLTDNYKGRNKKRKVG